MTLELNQVSPQVKAMGRRLQEQKPKRSEALHRAKTVLHQFSTEHSELHDRINRAETVQQSQRFGWVGAAPTAEALTGAYPLPTCPEQLSVIASDGSQILPDQHAIAPYFLINVGAITYRHGSNRKPDTHNPTPILDYEPFDDQGRLISPAEINLQRDLAELEILVDRAEQIGDITEPVVTLMDGQLALRVIDLPFEQQKTSQDICGRPVTRIFYRSRQHPAKPSSII